MRSSINEIGQRLRDDAKGVLDHLGIKYTMKNGEAWMGDLYGSEGKSCHVTLTGDSRGLIRDFAAGEGCDMLQFWANVKGLTLGEALREAKRYLGVDDFEDRFKPRRYANFPDSSKKMLKVAKPSETDPVTGWLVSRGIHSNVVSEFQVAKRKGKDGDWIAVFPHLNLAGKLVNCSYRKITEKTIWQEKGCAPTLFGWQTLTPEEIAGKWVVICEGHIDALSWRQAGFPALSIPSGSGMTWIENDWDDLECFDTFYVSMDMDGAGVKHFENLCSRLGVWRCRKVSLPEKDANDVLMKMEDPVKVLTDALQGAEEMKPKKVVSAGEIVDEVDAVMNPVQGLETMVKNVHLQAGGDGQGIIFRDGEVSVWTGYPGSGKTTLLSWLIASNVETMQRKAFVGSLEQGLGITGARILKQFMDVGVMSREDIERHLNELDDYLHFFRELGGSDAYEILDAMEYCYHRFGCKDFIIDNLMMIRAQRMDEKLVWQVDWVMKLIEFAKSREVHIHLVAHPKKTDEEEAPKMYDIYGASQIPGLVDNVIAVHRINKKKGDITQGSVELCSRKQRNGGWIGKVKLFFNRISQRFSKVSFDDVAEQLQPKERKKDNGTEERTNESEQGHDDQDPGFLEALD